MAILNFKELAKTLLREKTLQIAEAGYGAIDIKKSVSERISSKGDQLEIDFPFAGKKERFDLSRFEKIFLVGIGKGSALASLALAEILGDRLTGGIVLDVQNPVNCQSLKNVKCFVGNHPLPGEENAKATKEIMDLAAGLEENDLLINFICGGGSALACAPGEIEPFIKATSLLTKSGADILELNTVRKHLSDFKGGGLAKIAYPASVISLIVSDVLGNDLSMVASGPTVLDKTTKEDAENILKKFGVNSAEFNFRETEKDEKYFDKVKNFLFVSNRDAVYAMEQKARELGFSPKIHSLELKGEAKDSLAPMAGKIEAGEAILAAGETTVILANNQQPTTNDEDKKAFHLAGGKGGRNQESVLGLISNYLFLISKNLVVLSFASDGRDNSEAAGAIADYLTLEKAGESGLNPADFLKDNNSFCFFEKTEDLLFVEKKYFNVADLMMVIKEK